MTFLKTAFIKKSSIEELNNHTPKNLVWEFVHPVTNQSHMMKHKNIILL